MRIALHDGSEPSSSLLNRVTRDTLIAFGLVTTATAVGGGIALATGREGERFPVEWLRRTPFHSYRIPGLILGVVVGGSSAVATVATLRRSRLAAPASIVAGLAMIGWNTGEVRMLD